MVFPNSFKISGKKTSNKDLLKDISKPSFEKNSSRVIGNSFIHLHFGYPVFEKRLAFFTHPSLHMP
jgi:hypothetical protein